MRKGKNHPPEPFLPVAQAEIVPIVPTPPWGQYLHCSSLSSQGELQELPRQLSQGLVSSSSSVFAASPCPSWLRLPCSLVSPSAGSPMATVPQGCPQPSLAPSVVSSPWCGSPTAPGVQQQTPFTMTLSQLCPRCFQLLMALSRPYGPQPAVPPCGHLAVFQPADASRNWL